MKDMKLVTYDFPKGLLINFGAQSLEHKLIFNSRVHYKYQKLATGIYNNPVNLKIL